MFDFKEREPMPIADYFSRRIMIADDLPNMRADLRKVLTEMGFRNIKETADGKAAWDELRIEAQYGNPYDIIFSDINMPQMNGLLLLKNLRFLEAYKKTPIFMVSTENEKEIIVKAILEGATDYILKPFDPKVIRDKLMTRLK